MDLVSPTYRPPASVDAEAAEPELRHSEPSMKRTNESGESPLLSLPAEMRNMIYKYALVQGLIHISTGEKPPQPPLLQVNSEIRKEAIQIYYRENCFRWSFWAFDTTNYITWCRTSEDRLKAKVKFAWSGPRNWRNLLNWLQAYHNGECFKSGKTRGFSTGLQTYQSRARIFSKLSGLVRTMGSEQHLSWQQIKTNLDMVDAMLCELDEKWKEEQDQC